MFINGVWVPFPPIYFEKDDSGGGGAADDAKKTDEKSAGDKQDKPADQLGKDGKPFDPARAFDLIDKLREEIKDKDKVIAGLQKIGEIEEKPAKKGKGEKVEKPESDSELAQRLEKLEKQLEKEAGLRKVAELNTLRITAAAKFNLPEKLASRLKGETLEELLADAKELAETIPAAPGKRAGLGNGVGPDGKPVSVKQQLISRMSGEGSNPFDPTVHKEKGGGFVGGYDPNNPDD